jgi:hypothetical protein
MVVKIHVSILDLASQLNYFSGKRINNASDRSIFGQFLRKVVEEKYKNNNKKKVHNKINTHSELK